MQKGKLTKFNYRSNILKFGCIGLKATKSGTMSSRHIEAVRQAIVRKLSRKGKLWIRVFPTIPITAKPTETRMGKGKGAVDFWVAKVQQGQIIYEIGGVSHEYSLKALTAGSIKLPVKTKIISKKGL